MAVNDTTEATCTPEFYPDPRHSTHSREAHSKGANWWFYVVLTGRMCAVFTSMTQVEPLIRNFDGAIYQEARTWTEVLKHWATFCAAHHDHRSPPPSPRSCSDAFTISPLPSRCNSPCSFFEEPVTVALARVSEGKSVSKRASPRKIQAQLATQMASPPRTQFSPQRTRSLSPTKRLRTTQPSPSPAPQTVPQRTRSLSPNKPQQNVQPPRPPAPQAAKKFRFPQARSQPAYLPYPADMFEEIHANVWASELARATSTARDATTAASRTLDAVDSPPIPTPLVDIDDFSDSDVDESELSYSGVSTTSLTSLCERRDSPPGYEALIQASSSLRTFETPRLCFGISGHGVIYRSREDAFDVFQSTGASEFLMAASLEELRDFIGRHWPTTPPPVFVVSGHSVVVRDLSTALTQLLATERSEMLVTGSGAEAEEFLQRHRSATGF